MNNNLIIESDNNNRCVRCLLALKRIVIKQKRVSSEKLEKLLNSKMEMVNKPMWQKNWLLIFSYRCFASDISSLEYTLFVYFRHMRPYETCQLLWNPSEISLYWCDNECNFLCITFSDRCTVIMRHSSHTKKKQFISAKKHCSV